MLVTKMYQEDISKEEIEEKELTSFKGRIELVDTVEKLKVIIPELKREPILGFDTETKPSFTKGVTHKIGLVQLATRETAYLIRINKIGVPADLRDVLVDSSILKIGVAVRDDIRFIKGKVSAENAGFVDLQKLVRDYGIQCASLKKLTAIILGYKISKRQQVSNWEADRLSHEQIVYAATDAWVCYEIYKKLLDL